MMPSRLVANLGGYTWPYSCHLTMWFASRYRYRVKNRNILKQHFI